MRFKDIDFVIIGAAKSATTWLQKQLQSDPAVYMPDPELHYFSREYGRGRDWYLSQFSEDAQGKTIGEKSNSYLYSPQAAARLHRDMPHVKLIAQLRNPIERAYSSYCMLFRRGEVGPHIESYLNPSLSENMQILGSGDFASHLQPYLNTFGREKLLLLFFEGVLDAPGTQISRVRTHLGLPPRSLAQDGRGKIKDKEAPIVPAKLRKSLVWATPILRPLRGNPAFEAARGVFARKPRYPHLTDDLRQRLSDYYGPSIEALEQMSGQSLSRWHEPLPETAS